MLLQNLSGFGGFGHLTAFAAFNFFQFCEIRICRGKIYVFGSPRLLWKQHRGFFLLHFHHFGLKGIPGLPPAGQRGYLFHSTLGIDYQPVFSISALFFFCENPHRKYRNVNIETRNEIENTGSSLLPEMIALDIIA